MTPSLPPLTLPPRTAVADGSTISFMLSQLPTLRTIVADTTIAVE